MPKIRYACASLVAGENLERKTVNLDFAIGDSNKFNQIVFPLTQRGREYLPNIPQEEKLNWEHHSIIHQMWKNEKTHQSWIGKANTKKKWIPGKITKTHRIEKTGAFLISDGSSDCFLFKVWIEDWQFEIVLTPTDNLRFPYKGEYRDETVVDSIKGQWV
jgi:hypothetical protein